MDNECPSGGTQTLKLQVDEEAWIHAKNSELALLEFLAGQSVGFVKVCGFSVLERFTDPSGQKLVSVDAIISAS